MEATIDRTKNNSLYKTAFLLALFTIFYNIIEGIMSTFFGFEDKSLALFGFGSDSFIEVISGLGIANMIIRIRKQPHSKRDIFEKKALLVTGFAFYLLVFGLVITAIYIVWSGHKPITTLWGVVISIISIIVMWVLVILKKNVGNKLDSDSIRADANCTKICIYMLIILLVSSVI